MVAVQKHDWCSEGEPFFTNTEHGYLPKDFTSSISFMDHGPSGLAICSVLIITLISMFYLLPISMMFHTVHNYTFIRAYKYTACFSATL